MGKRLFDLVFSALMLLALAPFLAAIAVSIRLSSPGPVLYKAVRVGVNGRNFLMHKFRTMHVAQGAAASVITGVNDSRVYSVGKWLRKLKLDELPQLYDILRGEMSFVGPRPEDPVIVRKHYTAAIRETLKVRPGLASPGSIFNYTHGDLYLTGDNVEEAYAEKLLPIKMALEIVYVKRSGLIYDFRIMARTLAVIVMQLAGRKDFPYPPEMAEAEALLKDNRLSQQGIG